MKVGLSGSVDTQSGSANGLEIHTALPAKHKNIVKPGLVQTSPKHHSTRKDSPDDVIHEYGGRITQLLSVQNRRRTIMERCGSEAPSQLSSQRKLSLQVTLSMAPRSPPVRQRHPDTLQTLLRPRNGCQNELNSLSSNRMQAGLVIM